MIYLLDANTLIEAKNRYYSMTICPATGLGYCKATAKAWSPALRPWAKNYNQAMTT